MLIGIDASRANRSEKTGVEWYSSHLIQSLKMTPGQEAQSWLLYAPHSLSAELGEAPANWHTRILAWFLTRFWTQIRLSVEMAKHAPDVLFVPGHVFPRILPKRSVVTIHDVGFFRYPQLYSGLDRWWQRWSTRDSVRRASRVLTVSEYSKQEIVQFCQVNPEKITVIYPGADHVTNIPPSAEKRQSVIDRYRITGSYFLYLGRLETKKNILALIEAFRRYKEDRGLGDPVSLVLAGSPGEGYSQIQAAITQTALGSLIIQTGYVTEEDKATLLAGAIALVHPAWYEGFGFTPVEAMSLSCPVICARSGSLPEVVGVENALWFDPADPEALAGCLDQMMRDDVMRRALQEQGKGWGTRYTWQKAGEQLLTQLTNWDTR